MAYIPINPEYRDPGYFKKKAEIGLPSVDNMSVTEIVNAIAEDVKILGNKKKHSSKITSKGEFYGGLVRTSPSSSHASFTLGLFESSEPAKELAAVHVDFAFSCTSADEFGHLNYTICCPDGDQYLKDLYLIFSQVQDKLYVSLYSPLLPTKSSKVYFNLVGVNLSEWTEGVVRLDSGKDISDVVKNDEIARVRLSGPSSTVGAGSADALAVYNDAGRKVSLDGLSTLDGLDYPSINGVPFIGKRNLLIGNEETGRHIEVPAFHKDSTLQGSGVHDWEVLGNLRKINISKTNVQAFPESASIMPNDADTGYGLVKPSGYVILPPSSVDQNHVRQWLNHLGADTDVITVGAFKEYMSYILKFLFGEEQDTYHLFLENSEDHFKYVSSGESSFNLAINSFVFREGDKEAIPVDLEASDPSWISIETPENINNLWSIKVNCKANQTGEERKASITIRQGESSGREIRLLVTQEVFKVEYGILLDGVPVFEKTGYSFPRWENTEVSQINHVIPIKRSNTDPRGYTEIKDYQDFFLSNSVSWITSEMTEEGEVSLSAVPNNMSSVRLGTIYFGILENPGEKIKYVPILCSQGAATSYLHIDGNTEEGSTVNFSTGKNQVTKRFKISSNYTWSVVENSVPSWITLSGYTGERPSGNSYLTLIVSENNTQSNREAEIRITTKGGSSRVIKVTQISRSVYIDINNQAKDQFFSFDWRNEAKRVSSVTLEVNSNVNWFIDQCPSWLTPSVYDGGEDGKATTTPLTLSMSEPEYGTALEAVSLSYYDDETETIIALRKIIVSPGFVAFQDSNEYVLPQSSLEIDITSDGGSVTIGAFANVKYKLYCLGRKTNWVNDYIYREMLEESEYVSEDPKEDPTKQTYLSFQVTKNYSYRERKLRFILIPENLEDDPDSISPEEFPIFTVTQSGSKKITPFIPSDQKEIKTESAGFWVYRVSGNTTPTKPLPNLNPLSAADEVYGTFQAQKGQFILLSESDNLYRSKKKIPEVGDILRLISSTKKSTEEKNWFEVNEDGYYFSSTGEATLITPTGNKYKCEPGKSEITLTLGSVMNNCWDLYNETLPGWISLEKISGTLGFDTISVLIDENTQEKKRSCVLQFYVDSSEKTIESFVIEQSGIEIVNTDSKILGITPIVSSGKLSFTKDAFEVGLSSLVKYSSEVSVNEVKTEYTYSEYKESGVSFSLSKDTKGATILEDSYGKPKLVVTENTGAAPRSIEVIATYDGKTGSITLLQGSSEEFQFYTYKSIIIHPDFTTIPTGISKIGFTTTGIVKLATLQLSDGKISETGTQDYVEINFPYRLKGFEISDCGMKLISPDTLSYSGTIKDDCVISFPTISYSLNSEGELVGTKETIKSSPITFETGQENGEIVVGESLLSGSKSGTSLSMKLGFTKFPEIKITRTDSSSDLEFYMISSIPNSGATFDGPTDISVNLRNQTTEYLENKIVTFRILAEGKVQKYIHFRYMRALPWIGGGLAYAFCNDYSGSTLIEGRVEVSSNIGYTSSARSNSPENVTILGGEIGTIEVNPEDTRSVTYRSSGHPSRKWCKKYATETLILKDSDNIGISKEIPITVPAGNMSTPGFEISMGDEKLISFLEPSTEGEYNLYLPYSGGEATFTVRSYDSYILEKINEGNNDDPLNRPSFEATLTTISDLRNKIQSKVGSLGEMKFKIECNSVNTGTRASYRGSFLVKTDTHSFTIYVYQSAKTGLAQITWPKSKVCVLSSPTDVGILIFSHTYPGWMIVPENPVSTDLPVKMPLFTGKNYNSAYGSGGNSGMMATQGDGKTSSIYLSYDKSDFDISNPSLELKPLSECVPDEYTTPDIYGIKTAPVSTLQVSAGSVATTDTFKMMVRPDAPSYSILQRNDNGELIINSGPLKVSQQKIIDKFGNTLWMRNLYFYISTDIFDRTTPYIGKTITMNGEKLNIYGNSEIYNKLFEPVVIQYSSLLPGKNITETIYPTYDIPIDGKTYAYYSLALETISLSPGSETVVSPELTGEVRVEMKDFVVDNAYYNSNKPDVRTIPLTVE